MALKKLIVNVDEKLLQKLDEYAEAHHVNRTSAVSFLLTEALEQKQAMNTMQELLEIYQSEQNKQQ